MQLCLKFLGISFLLANKANKSLSVPTLYFFDMVWIGSMSLQLRFLPYSNIECSEMPLSISFVGFLFVLFSAKSLSLKGYSSEAANHLSTDFFVSQQIF